MTAAQTSLAELPPMPADPARRDAWRAELVRWRERARAAVAHDDARFHAPERAWVGSTFVCGLVMLWDEDVYDPLARRFTIADFLRRAEQQIGGYDAVVLWHAYPRIGFDDRNQFDFYRDVPGGIPGLREIVETCHAHGVRAIVDYNPWDAGTRRQSRTDKEALVGLVQAVGADGIFLDTLDRAMPGLRERLDEGAPGVALQSEVLVPLEAVRDHEITWVQSPPESPTPYLLRNKWFEPRQMQHLVRRWHRDHTEELHLAWLNGCGIVVWENVFGSWNPWRSEDRALLRSMRPTQRNLGRLFSRAAWTPFVETLQPNVHASLWEAEGIRLWTVVNASSAPVCGPILPVEPRPGERYAELITGRLLEPGDALHGEMAGRGVAAFVSVADPAEWEQVAATLRPPERMTLESRAPRRAPDVPLGSGVATCPPGMAAFAAVTRELDRRYRLRECGMDGPAPLANALAPKLHGVVSERGRATLAAYAIDETPVTNAEFQRFLAETGYRPSDATNFLHHWASATAPGADQEALPVVSIELDDARAYARWVGKRLPSEAEWQHALESGRVRYGAARVWEWTESETSDGHTRFCVVKGGADYEARGSEWYADGGPQDPDWAAKFILAWPGLNRCRTIGFRCAIDLHEPEEMI